MSEKDNRRLKEGEIGGKMTEGAEKRSNKVLKEGVSKGEKLGTRRVRTRGRVGEREGRGMETKSGE